MKYVMFCKTGGVNIYHPVIFPNHLAHADVAEALIKAGSFGKGKWKVVSAGDFNTALCKCSGRSSTLNLESDSFRDSAIIAQNDYGAGLSWD